MASINISLRKEAYEFLMSLKNQDKSFSDVILEFKERKSNNGRILALFEEERDLTGIDWKEKEKRIKSFKDSFNKKIKEIRKYMR